MLARTRCVVLALTIAVAGGILGCNRNNPVGPSSACSITLFPSTLRLSNAGGNGVVVVSTSSPQCSWTTTASWIAVDTGPSIGTGPLQYTVAPNPTAETRTGTVTVGTEVHTVVQACAYDVSPTSAAVYADTGGQGSIAVSTTAECPWTATTSESHEGDSSVSDGAQLLELALRDAHHRVAAVARRADDTRDGAAPSEPANRNRCLGRQRGDRLTARGFLSPVSRLRLISRITVVREEEHR